MRDGSGAVVLTSFEGRRDKSGKNRSAGPNFDRRSLPSARYSEINLKGTGGAPPTISFRCANSRRHPRSTSSRASEGTVSTSDEKCFSNSCTSTARPSIPTSSNAPETWCRSLFTASLSAAVCAAFNLSMASSARKSALSISALTQVMGPLSNSSGISIATVLPLPSGYTLKPATEPRSVCANRPNSSIERLVC